MQEQIQKLTICAVCKLPITREERPSVSLNDGRELRIECWNEYKRIERRRLN